MLQILHHAGQSACSDIYVTPEHRPEWAARLAEGALHELRAAAPGGDHQLAWARFLARPRPAEADLQLVSRPARGTAQIDGLDVDQELRWAFLHGLAADGRGRRGASWRRNCAGTTPPAASAS